MNLKMNKTNSCLIQSDKNNEFDSSKVKNPPESETQEELTENENAVDPENGDDYQDNRIPETACIPEVSDTPETTVDPEESVKTESSLSDISQDPAPSTETLCEEQDLTDKDASGSFKDEVAEYSYEITASATAYTAMDTTGGVDVALFESFKEKLAKLSPFRASKIFMQTHSGFYILDENNYRINATSADPQYNSDSSPVRNEPMVLISKNNRQSYCVVEFKRKTTDANAKYLVWGVCQLHDSSSFRLAQTKKTPLIFKKGSDTASYTFKVSNGTLSVPSSVQKLESIKWYYSKVKDEKADSGKLTDESFCKIYVVLREPIKTGGSYPPRKDVLDIACEVAKGKKDDDSIRDAMTGGLWGYLDGNGFVYTGEKTHCFVSDPSSIYVYNDYFRRDLDFNLSFAFSEQRLDCKDASSLSQICNNALGVSLKVIVAATPEPRTNYFVTKSVKGFGSLSFESYEFTHHQVSINTDKNTVFDPTCKFSNRIAFASNIRKSEYIGKIVNFEAHNCEMIWFKKIKVIKIY